MGSQQRHLHIKDRLGEVREAKALLDAKEGPITGAEWWGLGTLPARPGGGHQTAIQALARHHNVDLEALGRASETWAAAMRYMDNPY